MTVGIFVIVYVLVLAVMVLIGSMLVADFDIVPFAVCVSPVAALTVVLTTHYSNMEAVAKFSCDYTNLQEALIEESKRFENRPNRVEELANILRHWENICKAV